MSRRINQWGGVRWQVTKDVSVRAAAAGIIAADFYAAPTAAIENSAAAAGSNAALRQ